MLLKYLKIFILIVGFSAVNLINCSGQDLINAIKANNLETVSKLINSGIDINFAGINNETALIAATDLGNFEIVKELLNNGANPGTTIMNGNRARGSIDRDLARDGDTALHIAARKGYLDIIKELIKTNKCDIDKTNTTGTTALYYAAQHGHDHVIQMLVNAGADINKELEPDHFTAIYGAVCNDHINAVKKLIELGADVNIPNTDGDTVLIVASMRGNTEIVQELLEAGADIDKVGSEECTPLIAAICSAHLDAVKLLIDNGANVNFADRDGDTVLITAVVTSNDYKSDGDIDNYNKTVEIVKLITKANVDINRASNNGINPLHFAISANNVDIASYLLSLPGINKNLKTQTGFSFIHIAASMGHLEVLKLLIASGVDINLETDDGLTALHIAVKKGYTQMIRELAQAGADIEKATKYIRTKGYRSIHLAVLRNKIESVRELIILGVNINSRIQKSNGPTPLMLAAQLGYEDIAKFLIESGADCNVSLAKHRFSTQKCNALYYAYINGRINLVTPLLTAGSDCEIVINDELFDVNDTPAHRNGCGELVGIILNQVSEFNDTRAQFFNAVNNLDLETIKSLKALINIKDINGDTALHKAIKSKNYKLTTLLLAFGASENIKNYKCQTTQHLASARGKKLYAELISFSKVATIKLLDALKENNIKRMKIILNIMPVIVITARYGERENTILHEAINYGNPEAVKLILSIYPKIINIADKHGLLPIELVFSANAEMNDVLNALLDVAYINNTQETSDVNMQVIQNSGQSADSLSGSSKKREKEEATDSESDEELSKPKNKAKKARR